MGASGYGSLTVTSALAWVAGRPDLTARLDTGPATVGELSSGNSTSWS